MLHNGLTPTKMYIKSRVVLLSSCYCINVREVMKVNSLQNMNDALDFIEENLTNEIDFGEVAKRALCSEYHFRRLFSLLAGVTLSEYIRRRRFTLAAPELNDSNSRIMDLAVQYGHDSTDAFTRSCRYIRELTR